MRPEDIRPMAKVAQTPTSGPRPRSKNRLGRTKILTDEAEMNIIEEEHQNKLEKERKKRKKEDELKILKERNTSLQRKKRTTSEKENVEEVQCERVSENNPRVTRTGRVSKKRELTDL